MRDSNVPMDLRIVDGRCKLSSQFIRDNLSSRARHQVVALAIRIVAKWYCGRHIVAMPLRVSEHFLDRERCGSWVSEERKKNEIWENNHRRTHNSPAMTA